MLVLKQLVTIFKTCCSIGFFTKLKYIEQSTFLDIYGPTWISQLLLEATISLQTYLARRFCLKPRIWNEWWISKKKAQRNFNYSFNINLHDLKVPGYGEGSCLNYTTCESDEFIFKIFSNFFNLYSSAIELYSYTIIPYS